MLFVDLGDFHFNRIASYPLFYLSPIMFGGFLIMLSSIIEHRVKEWPGIIKPFLWISRNGITVLACHVYLIICSDVVLRILKISNPHVDFVLTFIATAIGLMMASHLINKYCPYVIGKNKYNSR